MRVEELIKLLEEFDPEAEVRLASKSRLNAHSIVDVDVLDTSDEFNASVVYVIDGGEVR